MSTMASAMDLTALEKDPRLFLYTSLTAGSSHIITATSRMETILKANQIPFLAIDIATNEKARRLWQRRAGNRKIPGLVKEGYVLGVCAWCSSTDLNEVEEWNEYGELRENIGPVPVNNKAPPGGLVGVQIAPPLSHNVGPAATSSSKPPSANKASQRPVERNRGFALPGAAEITARNPKSPTTLEATQVGTRALTSQESEAKSPEVKAEPKDLPADDHPSAPASGVPTGTATPTALRADAPEVPDAPNKTTQQTDDPARSGTETEAGDSSTITATTANESEQAEHQDEGLADKEDGGDDLKDGTSPISAGVKALEVDELGAAAEGEKTAVV